MPNPHPNIIILAGPNGAGKSTLAPTLLKKSLDVTEFVNADVIARGLSGFNPENAALAAGRIMLTRLKELATQRTNFAFETTLASQFFARWISGLLKEGFDFHLFFLWLPSPDFAIQRVADRVRNGGHNIPQEVIRRRYYAGLRNFFELYKPIATSWNMYDNSTPTTPKLIAAGGADMKEEIADAASWQKAQQGSKDEI